MRAVVLGAGVVGASVALAAKAAGFDVTVMAERRMTDTDAAADPLFASAFPAASTIPHSVPGSDFLELAKASNAVFEALSLLPSSGVRRQRHFELWETEPVEPAYGRALTDWIDIRNYARPIPIRRQGAKALYGYTFKMFFADMPVYAATLDSGLEKSGIAFLRRQINETAIASLEAEIVFDCLGAGAASVFPDLPSGFLYRGILLKFACDGLYAERATGEPISYNYTPPHAVYPAPNGGTWDVYFYPREGSLVLGGTRQQGTIDPITGAFSGAPYEGRVIEKDGVPRFRRRYWNSILRIDPATHRACALPESFTALIGYRHVCMAHRKTLGSLSNGASRAGAASSIVWASAARA